MKGVSSAARTRLQELSLPKHSCTRSPALQGSSVTSQRKIPARSTAGQSPPSAETKILSKHTERLLQGWFQAKRDRFPVFLSSAGRGRGVPSPQVWKRPWDFCSRLGAFSASTIAKQSPATQNQAPERRGPSAVISLRTRYVQLQGLLCLTPLALGHGAGNTTS